MFDGEGIMLTSNVMVRVYVEQGLVQRVLAGWCDLDVELNALFPADTCHRRRCALLSISWQNA